MKNDLRKRILPIMLYCQANKGDLSLYDEWGGRAEAGKKLFFAYYSGLFCRILCLLELDTITEKLIQDCDALLNKYHWYDIQKEDLELCKADGPYGCEVPGVLQFFDEVDNVVWSISGFCNSRDAVCLKMEKGTWSFADVRGSIK